MGERSSALPPWKLVPAHEPATDYVFAPKVVPRNDPLYVQAANLGAPELPLRVVVRDGWLGLAVYAAPGANRYCLLVNDGQRWNAGAGGASGGGPELPLRVSVGGSWSTPTSSPLAFAAVTIEGTVAPDITQVEIEFDDGHVEVAPVSEGAYGWFYARRPAPRKPPQQEFNREILGAEPVRVIGRAADGREIARQELQAEAIQR